MRSAYLNSLSYKIFTVKNGINVDCVACEWGVGGERRVVRGGWWEEGGERRVVRVEWWDGRQVQVGGGAQLFCLHFSAVTTAKVGQYWYANAGTAKDTRTHIHSDTNLPTYIHEYMHKHICTHKHTRLRHSCTKQLGIGIYYARLKWASWQLALNLN